MELALNLGWTAMATAMCWLWMRHARREGQRRSAQAVSLALVLFMMFVVITTYDDLAMAQNPAETRSFQLEDNLCAHAHAPLHPTVASIPAPVTEFTFNTFRLVSPDSLLVSDFKTPALSSIQNRPPPAV